MRAIFVAIGVLVLQADVLGAQETTLGQETTPPNRSSQESNRTAPSVVVSFDGGKTAHDMAAVLNIAVDFKISSSTRRQLVRGGDNVCKMLSSIGYPAPCEPIVPVVARINGRSEKSLLSGLTPGEFIDLPELVKFRSVESFSRRQSKDVSRSDSYLSHWGDLNVALAHRRVDNLTAGDKYAIEFDAFQMFFRTRNDTESTDFISAILRLKSAYISFEILREKPLPSRLNSGTTPQKLKEECDTGNQISAPLDYQDLSVPDIDAATIVRQGLPPSPTPVKVIIIDVEVSKAPNLYPAFGDAAPPANYRCQWTGFERARHHATHLAGIIASSANFGFRGLAQHTNILPFIWVKPRDDGSGILEPSSLERNPMLAETIIERSYDPLPLNVFLTASTFDEWEFELVNGKLPYPTARLQRTLEKRIWQRKPFLVVAAGQADNNQNAQELSPVSKSFPSNLGDWPNVVVVTACGPCGPSNVQLMRSAHFAEDKDRKFVHLAAPGGDPIPGWVSEQAISMAPGTSQASAYVAGVAAAMIGNFPDQYTAANEVKARLQTTSRPLPMQFGASHPDNNKLNAGVVDPILALLDPSKHWMKQNGRWRPIKLSAVSGAVKFRDLSDVEIYIHPEHVRRVYRMPSGGASRWTLYTDYARQNGDLDVDEVKRWGPLQSTNSTTRLFQVCDTPIGSLRLEDIDDLIISKRGIKKVCQ